MKFKNFIKRLLNLSNFEIAITFDGDVLRRWVLYRWQAESLSFPMVEESASEDITIKSYDPFEIQQNIPNWNAEIPSFPTVEESASEDITIKSYDPFEIGLKINKLYEKSQNS